MHGASRKRDRMKLERNDGCTISCERGRNRFRQKVRTCTGATPLHGHADFGQHDPSWVEAPAWEGDPSKRDVTRWLRMWRRLCKVRGRESGLASRSPTQSAPPVWVGPDSGLKSLRGHSPVTKRQRRSSSGSSGSGAAFYLCQSSWRSKISKSACGLYPGWKGDRSSLERRSDLFCIRTPASHASMA